MPSLLSFARLLLFSGLTLLVSIPAHASHHLGMSSHPGKALGVGVSELSSEALNSLGLEHGVRVEQVVPDSPAQVAGIRQGDVIVEMSGKPAYSVERLQWLVRQAPESEPANVRLQRDGDSQTVSVTFQRPPTSATPSAGKPQRHGREMAFLGVQIQPMTAQLRDAFGASEDAGLLVAQVLKDSPADKAGIAVGDVIVRMDRRSIQHMPDFYRVLRYFDPGDSVEVEVIREKASETLTVQLGEATRRTPRHGWHPMPHHPHHVPYPG